LRTSVVSGGMMLCTASIVSDSVLSTSTTTTPLPSTAISLNPLTSRDSVDHVTRSANAAGIKHVVASRDQQEEQRRSTYDDLPWSHPISLLASGTLAEKEVRSFSAVRPLAGWTNE
jgi:hypothetical protein